MCATRDPGYRGDSGLEPLPTVDELDEQERPLWAFFIFGYQGGQGPPAGNRLACSLNRPLFWTKAPERDEAAVPVWSIMARVALALSRPIVLVSLAPTSRRTGTWAHMQEAGSIG